MTSPKPGQKFHHKLLANHPECTVKDRDGAFVLYETPDGKTHSVYANEFKNIVEDEHEDRSEDSDLPPVDKPGSPRSERLGSHATRGGSRRAAPDARSDR